MASTSPVQYNDMEYDVVKEGLAAILSLRKEKTSQPSKKRKVEENGADVQAAQSVFYNPVQQFNRDLSVLAIKVFSEDLSIIRRHRHERALQKPGRKSKRERDSQKQTEPTKSKAAASERKRRTEDREETEPIRAEAAGITMEQQNRVDFSSSNGKTTAHHAEAVAEVDSTVEMNASQAENQPTGDKNILFTTIQDPLNHIPNESAHGKNALSGTETSEQTSNNEKEYNSLETQTPDAEMGTCRQAEPPKDREKNLSAQKDSQSRPSFRILDALSATGLRAIRYAKEIPLATSITANDISSTATASIALNVRHNELRDKIIPITSEAQVHLSASASKPTSKYEVIDLDPYGTAVPFLDSAIQALVDGGLLCVTCTDASLFASMGYLEKTFTLYRGLPYKGQQSHEVGLRLVLNVIATSAASYGIAIEPLLSISADFYVRLFVRVRRALGETKLLGSKTMLLYYCGEGCGAFSMQPMIQTREKKDKIGQPIYKHTQARAPTTTPTCEHCDYKLHLAGPMWGGPIHNPYFIQRILDGLSALDESTYATIPRIKGMLTTARDEILLPDDSIPLFVADQQAPTSVDQPFSSLPASFVDPAPLFIHPPSLCKALHCITPPDAALRGALLGLGYRVTRSHTEAGSIKTDAPWSLIWEVMREWTRQKAPVKEGAITKGTAGWGLMKRDRKNMKIAMLKEEVEAVLKEKDRLEEITDGLHAALYRASFGNSTKAHEGIENVKDINDEVESPTAVHGKDPVTNGDASAPRAKGKKPRERNSYKKIRDDQGSDGLSPSEYQRRPTMTRPGYRPLSALQRSELDVVFDERLGSESGVKGLVRYQVNPRENWGPIKRARVGE